MKCSPRSMATLAAWLWLCSPMLPSLAAESLVIQSESVGPQHFMAVHGRQALIQGYTGAGLEMWAYPLQILNDYRVAFREPDGTSLIDAASTLRSIRYTPDAIERTYVGADFVVRETLFVPLNQAAAIITYSVDSAHPIDIVAGFDPVLDLMWPASIGGQATRWNAEASAYVLFEPTGRFTAFVGSPDIVTHDVPQNAAMQTSASRRPRFSLRVGGAAHRSADVVIGLLDKTASDPSTAMKQLLAGKSAFEREARAHYTELADQQLQIVTPDDAVNSALAWAAVAVDQSWVCNPYLGCGVIAGYGASRDARRPQYEWFFAGDGLVATDAMVALGQYERARDELAFIFKYQDPDTGRIWHELSQSASFLDWNKTYPYMFVHVDISLQFLTGVARYASATGDTAFINEHWNALRKAYAYSRSLLSATDGLPRIPSTKQGHSEQEKLTDELSLSVGWLQAADSFAQLARMTGHTDDAVQAEQARDRARKSIASRYWLPDRQAWIGGHTISGKTVAGRSSNGISLIDNHVLDTRQEDIILDQIASADFQSDWGTRGIAATSPDADPGSYARGSVSAFGTAYIAAAYWNAHRPVTAFAIWNSLIPWNRIDSPGHLHELLAGDVYHQQTESVPEQTWSSAAFVTATVGGLLGLRVYPDKLTFAPNMPAAWDTLAVNHIKVRGGSLDLSLRRTGQGIELTAHNRGDPVALHFSPQIPFGAHLTGVDSAGTTIKAVQDDNEQDTHASMDLTLARGDSRTVVNYRGGVEVGLPRVEPMPGDRSIGAKITGMRYRAGKLVVGVDAIAAQASILQLRTTQKILAVDGAVLRPLAGDRYELTIAALNDAATYRHVDIAVTLTDGATGQ
jgi:glycogen debranching enzyme